jgi:hypothetical protein
MTHLCDIVHVQDAVCLCSKYLISIKIDVMYTLKLETEIPVKEHGVSITQTWNRDQLWNIRLQH